MSFEFPESQPDTKKTEALDDKWYERFKEIGSFQDFEYLSGNKKHREEQRKKFLSGEVENPTLDYPELKKLNIEEKEEKLLNLKKDIKENEPNQLIKQVYRWKLNEKIAEIRMLKSARSGDDGKFFRYSKFIYGFPEKSIYTYSLKMIKEGLQTQINSPYLDIVIAAKKLQAELFEKASAEQQIAEKPVSFPLSRLSFSPETSEKKAEDIKAAFEGALEVFQVRGFKVLVDKNGGFTAINVSQEKSMVNIPEDRKTKQSHLKALMAHEIGTHAQRREKGERSSLKLLGLGLDRYLKGEEGVARYAEQQIEGDEDYAGFDYHLAASLAIGLDGKKRNFRQVFEILKDLNFINSKTKDPKKAKENAEKNAWKICVRIFRGTTCKTPGACFTRDIVYREGNIGIWNLVKNNPEEIRRFSIGKYDPTNPRHIWILDQLGITEEDLTSLDKEN